MSAVEVTITGVLFDKYARTGRPVTLVGEAILTGLGVGGGPIYPPEQPPSGGQPPGIWGGPIDPYPDHGLPGAQPRPEHPIVMPPDQPPTEPPTGPADEDGFIKPPPADGGWAYHNEYGWLYSPGPTQAGPKKAGPPSPRPMAPERT